MLSGQHVNVRPFSDGDMPAIRRWQNTPGTGPAFLGHIAARPLSGTPELYRVSWVKNLMVEDAASHAAIGVIRIDHVRMMDRNAAVFCEVGEKAYESGPHAEEGLRLVLGHLFGEQNLRRVYTYLMDHEKNITRIFEKTGFRREVVLTDRLYYAGAYHPVYIYGLLAEELQ